VPPSSVRLPLTVDVAALRADLDGLREDDWVPHFNTGVYEGDWSGVALRSVGGMIGRLYPDPTASADFADTAVLERCPGVAATLSLLPCPLLAVRFLRLGPGARIKAHADLDLAVEDGEVRLHLPVTTSADVRFHLDGRLVDMAPGEAWYLDLNLRHAVENDGTEPRVHLVVDCVVDDWLRAAILG
jgi:hypothetical protein